MISQSYVKYSVRVSLISGARETARARAIPFSPAPSFIPSNNKVLLTVPFRVSLPEHAGAFPPPLGTKTACLILNVTRSPPVHYSERIKLRMGELLIFQILRFFFLVEKVKDSRRHARRLLISLVSLNRSKDCIFSIKITRKRNRSLSPPPSEIKLRRSDVK